MSIDIQKFATNDVISIPFGMRLKSAREARGLESKDVAAQLRLSEKMISMLEKETYPADLPVTFIRGYIRAYARLMEIPDSEITKALEPIKPQIIVEEEDDSIIEAEPVTSSNYFMQFFTYLILLTIIGLVAVWWYAHPSSDTHTVTTTEVPLNQSNIQQPIAPTGEPPIANSTESSQPVTATNFDASATSSTLAIESQAGSDQIKNKADDAKVVRTPILPLNSGTDTALINEKLDFPSPVEIITSYYPLQFFTHLILFLFISFIMLWWHQYLTFTAHTKDSLNTLSSHFNNSLNLELATELHAHGRTGLLSPSEQRTQREIKKTMNILTSLVFLSLLSLISLGWYQYTAMLANTETLSANVTTQPTIATKETAKITHTVNTTPTEKIATQFTTATSVDKNDNVESSETPMQINSNKSAENNDKPTNPTASISSGKYTPVPDVKKPTSKHKRKAAVIAPVVDEFAELDDDNQ